MILKGNFAVKAPIRDLWNFFLNPENMADCIPGCEKLAAVNEKEYEFIVSAKVSFISVRFKGNAEITETDAPRFLKGVSSGEDLTKLGRFKSEIVLHLEENSNGDVHLSYKANVDVVGKIATLGDRIMRAKAKQIEAEFTQKLSDKLSGKKVAQAKLSTGIFEIFSVLWVAIVEKMKKVRIRFFPTQN